MNTFFLNYSGRKLKVTNVDDKHTIKYISAEIIPAQYPDFFKGREVYLKLSLTENKLSKYKTYYNIRTLGDAITWHKGSPLLVVEIGPPVGKNVWKCTVQ